MMGTPGNRSTEPGLQGLQNRKAARQWAAFFAITLPRQSSTIKKIRKPPYSSGGALGFHRNGPTMRGRALDCCRNRGRAGTNPGTPERPSETGTAALRTGQAITLYFFPAATFIDHPAVSGTPRTIIRKSKCSTDFKRNDFLKKTKRTHWVRFVHLNSLIESCVFLYLWNSPFDTFL